MARKEIDRETLARAEQIYEAYPRKVGGRPRTIAAIVKALGKEEFDVLLDAVQEFAECTRGTEKHFLPYPATWFNQERWTDDRDEWRRRPSMKPETAIELVKSQFAAADEAWSIVRQVAKRMETTTPGLGSTTVRDTPENRRLSESVPEPARSVAMSIRWTNIRFGEESSVRKEFCILYERRLRAEVNRRVAPSLLGEVGLPGVEQRRIEG